MRKKHFKAGVVSGGLFLVLLIIGMTKVANAAPEDCEAIFQNFGQCVCHNFQADDSTPLEICPSASGIASGHDCHLADFCCSTLGPKPIFCNMDELDCSNVNFESGVEDRFGKCNGCGDGLPTNNEGCCDPDTDEDCDAQDPNTNVCEECDDGSNVDGDGCDANCQLEQCGDGNLDFDEECDDGNNQDGDGCNNDCQTEDCGDGIVNNNEECDDGNKIDNDSCSNDCNNNLCAGISCNDQNPCTNDLCDPDTGCFHTNNTNSCNDGNACTIEDTCSVGECNGRVRNCNDENICTNDSCNPASGCLNPPSDQGTTTCGIGECHNDVDNCAGGVIQECTPLPTPKPQIEDLCEDGKDNDCDGLTDDDDPDCAGEPAACETTNTPPTTDDRVEKAMGEPIVVDVGEFADDPDEGPNSLRFVSVTVVGGEGTAGMNSDRTQIEYVSPDKPDAQSLVTVEITDGDSCNGIVTANLVVNHITAGGGFCSLVNGERPPVPMSHKTLWIMMIFSGLLPLMIPRFSVKRLRK